MNQINNTPRMRYASINELDQEVLEESENSKKIVRS
jgi:hypothetical protein